jgi:hypothetical protein
VIYDNGTIIRQRLDVRSKYNDALSVLAHTDIADGSLVRVGILPIEGDSFLVFKEELVNKGCVVIPYAIEKSGAAPQGVSADSIKSKTKDEYIQERISRAGDKYDKSLLNELLQEVMLEESA